MNVSCSNPDDGDTLVFHASTNSFRAEPKNTAGDGKSLILTKGANTLCEFNGSKSVTLDISEAEKFSAARTIKLTGHATGQVDFDGSKNVELEVTGVTASLTDAADYAAKAERLVNSRKISIGGMITAAAQDFDGTADLALNVTEIKLPSVDKLTTARKIKFVGDVTGEGIFDGSGDLTITLTAAQAKSANQAAEAHLATKAEKDAVGNNIVTTYATKEEVDSKQFTAVDTYLTDYAKTEDVENTYAKNSEVVKQSELASEVAGLNAGSSDKLSSARTIKLSGAVKGSVTFDGSKDAEIEVDIADSTSISEADLAAIFYYNGGN